MPGDVDTEYQQILETVRRLAEVTAAEADPERMLRMAGALGNVATGVRDFFEIYDTEQVLPASAALDLEPVAATPPEVAVEPPVSLPEPAEPAETPALSLAALAADDEVLVPAVTESEPPAPVAAVASKDAEQPASEPDEVSELVPTAAETEAVVYTEDDIRRAYVGLDLRDRQFKLLQTIHNLGQHGPIKQRDVTAALREIGVDLTPAAGQVSFSVVYRKVQDSPYRDRLQKVGKGNAIEYHVTGFDKDLFGGGTAVTTDQLLEAVVPERQELPEVPVSENNEQPPRPRIPTPQLMPQHRVDHVATPPKYSLDDGDEVVIEHQKEADPNAILAQFGLLFSQNGHKELSVRGVPLKLTDFEVSVIMEVARAEGPVPYRDLLRSKALAELWTDGNVAKQLNTALQTIKSVTEAHELPWSDGNSIVDGKKIRAFQLGKSHAVPKPAEAEETPDFLA